MEAHTKITVNITLSDSELANLCAAVFESTEYWYEHLSKATDAEINQEEYHLSKRGCKIVYDERIKLYETLKSITKSKRPTE